MEWITRVHEILFAWLEPFLGWPLVFLLLVFVFRKELRAILETIEEFSVLGFSGKRRIPAPPRKDEDGSAYMIRASRRRAVIEGDVYVRLRAVTVLRDSIQASTEVRFPPDFVTPDELDRELYGYLLDWVLSGSVSALEKAKAILSSSDMDAIRRERANLATKIPLRILEELGGGPPAGRSGKPRTDSQILDDVIASLYSVYVSQVEQARELLS